MKSQYLLTTIIIPLLLIGNTIFAGSVGDKKYAVRTVVIDAGHGGHDPGCLGASSQEKKIALAIAMKLGGYIEKNFPEIKVIYTRTTDVFVELHERAAIANRNNADLFISIHCNSGPTAVYGTETYVMGIHKSEDNLKVSKRENSVVLMEENYMDHYEGFDPNAAEAHIIFSLYQNAYMEQSILLANSIQHQFETRALRRNREVKQAGFLVLYRTAMPSVLIETGFLTNGAEERYMKSHAGQEYLASAIYRAFKEYKVTMEGGNPALANKDDDTPDPTKAPIEDPVSEATGNPPVAKETPKPEPVVIQQPEPVVKGKPIEAPTSTVTKKEDPPEEKPVATNPENKPEPKPTPVEPKPTPPVVAEKPAPKETSPTTPPADKTIVASKPEEKPKEKEVPKVVHQPQVPAKTEPANPTDQKPEKPVVSGTPSKPEPVKPVVTQKEQEKEDDPPAVKDKEMLASKDPMPVVKEPAPKPDPAKPDPAKTPKPEPVKPEPSKTAPAKTPKPAPAKPDVATNEPVVIFRVQVGISREPFSADHPKFKDLEFKDFYHERMNETTVKNLVGKYTDLSIAIQDQRILRQNGFKDAFIVPFHNGKRISMKEANELLKK